MAVGSHIRYGLPREEIVSPKKRQYYGHQHYTTLKLEKLLKISAMANED